MLNDPGAWSSAAAWSMNVCSSVGIIMVNKAVMYWHKFKYPTTLTALHFITAALVGYLSRLIHPRPKGPHKPRGGAFLGGGGGLSDDGGGSDGGDEKGGAGPGKHVPGATLLWFSVVASVAVVAMNLSLMLNSVGFYQIAKLSIIPSCCLFEALLHGKTYSPAVKLSVVVVMLGVAVCMVTDVSVSIPGLIAAVAAVLSTTFQQIYIGQLQKKYSVGSFDLLSLTAPYQAALLGFLGPPVDYVLAKQNVLAFRPTRRAVFFIALSCLLALFVNLSMYLCIGKFSAVSFQVLGHMKTLLVLALGWVLFGAAVTLKNVAGMAVAVVGMVMYSWAVEREKNKQPLLPIKAAAAESERLLDGEKRED